VIKSSLSPFLSHPNGTAVSYTYDINNRLTNLTHKNSVQQVLASYAYTLGAIGNRTRIDENTGIARIYEYDNLYRLTKDQVTDPTSVQTYTTDYAYDAVGNRLTKTHNAVATDYTYNNADQLVTENGITYTYDMNGNLATKSDASGTTTYSYDYDNRLVGVAAPSGTTTYKYDAEGNRVEATTSAGTTKYLVDTNRSLAQVLTEYTTAGALLASYVYADDLISMTRGGQTFYYHFDGLGSTRLLTDTNGSVTDTYSYDAFGNLIQRTGNTDNPFLFTGQQYDVNIGFYYLRARYYSPSNGRFAALDPFVGDPFAPMSLHRYLYANADSVNKIDPSGAMTMTEAFTAINMVFTLVSLNTAIHNPTAMNIAFAIFDVFPPAKFLSVASKLGRLQSLRKAISGINWAKKAESEERAYAWLRGQGFSKFVDEDLFRSFLGLSKSAKVIDVATELSGSGRLICVEAKTGLHISDLLEVEGKMQSSLNALKGHYGASYPGTEALYITYKEQKNIGQFKVLEDGIFDTVNNKWLSVDGVRIIPVKIPW